MEFYGWKFFVLPILGWKSQMNGGWSLLAVLCYGEISQQQLDGWKFLVFPHPWVEFLSEFLRWNIGGGTCLLSSFCRNIS